jgi:hypothetical protein
MIHTYLQLLVLRIPLRLCVELERIFVKTWEPPLKQTRWIAPPCVPPSSPSQPVLKAPAGVLNALQ